jgi:tetratricopeptide (TPR) repeat protein
MQAAIADCESAMRLEPNDIFSHIYRAFCYRDLGEMERARDDARKVMELTDNRPKWFHQYVVRMDALVILGQPQQTVHECVAMLRTEGCQDLALSCERVKEGERDPRFAFTLAMARWKLGEKDVARRWYDKAVERIDKTKPEDESLRRFHEEAAAMLGIPVKPPAAKEKTEAKPKAESGKGK